MLEKLMSDRGNDDYDDDDDDDDSNIIENNKNRGAQVPGD